MSTGMKRTAAPPVPGEAASKKPAGGIKNGQAPAPLSYSSGEPTDDVNMNEVDEKVTLNVFMTSGKCASVTVDSNIPMLDLLVHVAATCKVSPAGHVLQARDEDTGKVLEYKPNQTVGSLGTTSLHLLPKNKKPDWSKAANANKAVKAFEITNRFTINLPGGQKAVMRVSHQLTLAQVLAKVCQDKSLDSNRYTLQHPTQPATPLDLQASIADSKLVEINLVYAAGSSSAGDTARYRSDSQRPAPPSSSPSPPSATSTTAASKDPSTWYMPGAGETKKKKGFLSFLTKKEKKFKLDPQAHMETSSTASHFMGSAVQARRPVTPPPQRRASNSELASKRPQTMYVTSSTPQDSPRSLATDTPRGQLKHSPQGQLKNTPRDASSSPRAPASSRESSSNTSKGQLSVPKDSAEPRAPPRGGKKRPAPPPPQARSAVGEDVIKPAMSAPVAAAAPGSSLQSAEMAAASRLHSRNSSDSSGYHELTLSGAESPEASRLQATFKTSLDTTSIDSCDNLNGDSGIQDMSPASDGRGRGSEDLQASGRVSSSRLHPEADLTKTLPSTKKKKAPPPPKVLKSTVKPAPLQEEAMEASSKTDLPCDHTDGRKDTEHSPAPLGRGQGEVVAEEPPPPLTLSEDPPPSLSLDLGFLNETDTDSEKQRTNRDTDRDTERDSQTKAEAEYKEAFNLDDILDGVVFDDEPRRTINIKTSTSLNDDNNDENTDEDDAEMAMTETSSVLSEEVVMVVDDVRSRPCAFIPPPPPDEPPPEDYSPRGSHPLYADKSTVVGDDNISLKATSIKNSPVLRSSVETKDRSPRDTDAACDVPADSGHVSSTDTSLSLPDTDMDGASDSSARQEEYRHTWDNLHSPGAADKGPSGVSQGDSPRAPLDVDSLPPLESLGSAFAMSEEISAPLETVPPPLQFQSEEEEDGEEEESVTVTEEFIVPMAPTGMIDFTSAVRVSETKNTGYQLGSSAVHKLPDFVVDEPEQFVKKMQDSGLKDRHHTQAQPVSSQAHVVSARHEPASTRAEPTSTRHEPVSLKHDSISAKRQPFVEPASTRYEPVSSKPEPVKSAPVQEPAAPVKEEFVLTMEDLSSVSLVPLRPKVYSQPKPRPPLVRIPSPTPPSPTPDTSSEAVNGSPQRSRPHLAYVSDHGHVLPATSDATDPGLFSGKDSSVVDSEGASGAASESVYRSTAKLTMLGRTSPSNVSKYTDSLTSNKIGDSSGKQSDSHVINSRLSDPLTLHKVHVSPTLEVTSPDSQQLQQQYSALQQQFSQWQQQLQQNQALLASGNPGASPGQDHTLKAVQMQMTMQQEMMEQLQRSMQALSVQQPSVTQGRSSPSLQITPPPPPPLAPVPAPVVKRSAVSRVETRPVSSRFQPQLDPREELMIAIRSFGGITGLNSVPVSDARWVSGSQ